MTTNTTFQRSSRLSRLGVVAEARQTFSHLSCRRILLCCHGIDARRDFVEIKTLPRNSYPTLTPRRNRDADNHAKYLKTIEIGFGKAEDHIEPSRSCLMEDSKPTRTNSVQCHCDWKLSHWKGLRLYWVYHKFSGYHRSYADAPYSTIRSVNLESLKDGINCENGQQRVSVLAFVDVTYRQTQSQPGAQSRSRRK